MQYDPGLQIKSTVARTSLLVSPEPVDDWVVDSPTPIDSFTTLPTAMEIHQTVDFTSPIEY